MQRRTCALFVILLLLGGVAPTAHARPRAHVLAQQGEDLTGTDDEGAGQEQQSGERGAGQDKPSAETGASQGQTEGASDETGPPWTYQMARITVVLLVLLGLGIAGMYYRLVASRRRAGI